MQISNRKLLILIDVSNLLKYLKKKLRESQITSNSLIKEKIGQKREK
jgi:hypothetical protein